MSATTAYYRPRGWDVVVSDGTLPGTTIGTVFLSGGTEYVCHLKATPSAACVTGRGDTRNEAVERALELRAGFAAAVDRLVDGIHEQEDEKP